jgi:hypothetical protein
MLKHIISLLSGRQGAEPAAIPSPVIDPDDVFDDRSWPARDEPARPVRWSIRTRDGAIEAEGWSIEIVEGTLHVLDGNEDVLLAAAPGAWERVEAAPAVAASDREDDAAISGRHPAVRDAA